MVDKRLMPLQMELVASGLGDRQSWHVRHFRGVEHVGLLQPHFSTPRISPDQHPNIHPPHWKSPLYGPWKHIFFALKKTDFELNSLETEDTYLLHRGIFFFWLYLGYI